MHHQRPQVVEGAVHETTALFAVHQQIVPQRLLGQNLGWKKKEGNGVRVWFTYIFRTHLLSAEANFRFLFPFSPLNSISGRPGQKILPQLEAECLLFVSNSFSLPSTTINCKHHISSVAYLGVTHDDAAVFGACQCHVQTARIVEEANALVLVGARARQDNVILAGESRIRMCMHWRHARSADSTHFSVEPFYAHQYNSHFSSLFLVFHCLSSHFSDS